MELLDIYVTSTKERNADKFSQNYFPSCYWLNTLSKKQCFNFHGQKVIYKPLFIHILCSILNNLTFCGRRLLSKYGAADFNFQKFHVFI